MLAPQKAFLSPGSILRQSTVFMAIFAVAIYAVRARTAHVLATIAPSRINTATVSIPQHTLERIALYNREQIFMSEPKQVSMSSLSVRTRTFQTLLENRSHYDLVSVTLALSLIRKDAPWQTRNVTVSVKDERGGPLIAGMHQDVCATSDFARDTQHAITGYWISVQSAKGIPHGYDSVAPESLRLAIQLDDAVEVAKLLDAHVALLKMVDPETQLLPLQWAAENDSAAVAALLIARGATVDSLSQQGYTALCLATSRNAIEVAQILIDAHANVNFRHKDNGNTPLHEAAHYCDISGMCPDTRMIRLLLDNCADRAIRNRVGQLPADLSDNVYVKMCLLPDGTHASK